jgi:Tol biopolymer transport system component
LKLVPLKQAGLLLFVIALIGCNYPSTPLAPTVDVVATAVTGTLVAEGIATPEPSQGASSALPHSVYFIREISGSAQVWKLEQDGETQQVTHEASGITSYDVSRVDGSVAFVVNNQLYMTDTLGGNRRLLVDNSAANPEAEDYVYREMISNPQISPDGRFLAYGFNGLWTADLSTFQATQLLTNEVQENEGIFVPVSNYNSIQWSPDSQKVLISIGNSESIQLSILNLGDSQLLTDLQSSNPVLCCQVSWTQDSSSILVASPFIGLIEPGLWRYNALTGEETEMIGRGDDGLFEFVGWPLELADGNLQYFYSSSTEIPSSDLPLFMTRSEADGSSNRIQLRSDSFSNIGEVLWADDGSLALIVQLNPSGTTSGSVVLAVSDDSQLEILLPDARDLKWGP